MILKWVGHDFVMSFIDPETWENYLVTPNKYDEGGDFFSEQIKLNSIREYFYLENQ